jgi:hypothetical protein
MKGSEPRLPDLMLGQYALGELSGAEKARVDARLAVDPRLRRRLEALRRSDEAILSESPPAEIAASIRSRMLVFGETGAREGRPGRAKKRRFGPGASLAFPSAAAVLVLVGVVMAHGLLSPDRGDGPRAESGAPGLSVYKKAASGPVRLADGELVAAGDLLQIKYSAGSARYGAIVSLDGAGSVAWHLPGEGRPAGPAPPIDEKGAALDYAYQLDDAPAFERFFIFSSGEDFDLSLASKALGDLARSGAPESGALRLPSGLDYRSLLLRKAAR